MTDTTNKVPTNPDSPGMDSANLDDLRRDIDAADEEMHRLLIHRGRVIEQLIKAKKLGTRGAAFRPQREAEMMRRIAARHSGHLPLSIVEHIWREIIGTFTQLQAPYRIYSAGAGDPLMRDLMRYYFGFSGPLVESDSNLAAVEAVARSGADLAVVAVDDPLEERWWNGLNASSEKPEGEATARAKVIAMLPFLPTDPRLELPRALVIGPANVEAPTDLFLYAVDGEAKFSGTVVALGKDCALVASRLAPDALEIDGAICVGSYAEPPKLSE